MEQKQDTGYQLHLNFGSDKESERHLKHSEAVSQAEYKKLLQDLDGWIRRKLRCYRLKQCKRVITLQRFLESMGVKKWQSWILALSGKGYWRK